MLCDLALCWDGGRLCRFSYRCLLLWRHASQAGSGDARLGDWPWWPLPVGGTKAPSPNQHDVGVPTRTTTGGAVPTRRQPEHSEDARAPRPAFVWRRAPAATCRRPFSSCRAGADTASSDGGTIGLIVRSGGRTLCSHERRVGGADPTSHHLAVQFRGHGGQRRRRRVAGLLGSFGGSPPRRAPACHA